MVTLMLHDTAQAGNGQAAFPAVLLVIGVRGELQIKRLVFDSAD
jgi:hypothetical protein